MSKGEDGFCPFAYQGQIIDKETGLYYNRFRYYSPEEGMYISQDPIRLRGGHRFYNYVGDINSWIDPFGLGKCTLRDATEEDGDCDVVLTVSRQNFSDDNEAIDHMQNVMNTRGDTYTYEPENASSQRDKSLTGISTQSGKDRDELTKAGNIDVITQDKVKEIFANEPKKIKKQLPNVLANMGRNNEVLIHGQIPENKICIK